MEEHLFWVASSTVLWSGTFVVEVMYLALEHIQKCTLRIVLEDYESSYEELLSKCGMSMLEIQRARTLAFDIQSIHQMTPIYIQEMFNVKVTPYDLRDRCRTVMPKVKTTWS